MCRNASHVINKWQRLNLSRPLPDRQRSKIMPDLTTTYPGLSLSNPLVASASPLSKKLDRVRQLEDAGIHAFVLASLIYLHTGRYSHQEKQKRGSIPIATSMVSASHTKRVLIDFQRHF